MSLIMKELIQIGESALTKLVVWILVDAELIMMFMLSMNRQQLFIKSPRKL